MPVAVEAYDSHQTIVKRTDDDGFGCSPKLFTHRPGVRGEVIVGRGSKGQGRVEQGLPPQLRVGISVFFSK
jgi:hypothetical protein